MKRYSFLMIFVLSTCLSIAYPGDARAWGEKTIQRVKQSLKRVRLIAPNTHVLTERHGYDKADRALENFKSFFNSTRTSDVRAELAHEFDPAARISGPVKLVNIKGPRRVLKLHPLYEGEKFNAVATDTMSIFR